KRCPPRSVQWSLRSVLRALLMLRPGASAGCRATCQRCDSQSLNAPSGYSSSPARHRGSLVSPPLQLIWLESSENPMQRTDPRYRPYLLQRAITRGVPLFAFGLAAPLLAFAQDLRVTTFADQDDGQCTAAHCSLREAISAANAHPGETRIQLEAGEYLIEKA